MITALSVSDQSESKVMNSPVAYCSYVSYFQEVLQDAIMQQTKFIQF